ncbi:hypothetical protein DFH06DRAFT_1328265 [Mycena polygramma]|nr:hypothetical protein DFH06DRAFT_1328265 [Mycena polygramma]
MNSSLNPLSGQSSQDVLRWLKESRVSPDSWPYTPSPASSGRTTPSLWSGSTTSSSSHSRQPGSHASEPQDSPTTTRSTRHHPYHASKPLPRAKAPVRLADLRPPAPPHTQVYQTPSPHL